MEHTVSHLLPETANLRRLSQLRSGSRFPLAARWKPAGHSAIAEKEPFSSELWEEPTLAVHP